MITTQFRSTAHPHSYSHHRPHPLHSSHTGMNVLSPSLQLLPTPASRGRASRGITRRGGSDDPLRDEDPSSSHGDGEDALDEAEDYDDDEEEDVEAQRRRQSTPIAVPGPHDVLLGRGGGTNNHHGNVKFRQLVGEHKMQYFAASKVQKPRVARLVVELWRKMDPPGRFLERARTNNRRDSSASSASRIPAALQGAWFEVGDKKAREKASQCLRERTAEVMPYIKKLREHQDAQTEQGVHTFQQRVQLHEEEQRRAAASAVDSVAAAQALLPPPGAVVSPSAVPSADDLEGYPHGSNALLDGSGRGGYPVPPPSLLQSYHSPYDARYGTGAGAHSLPHTSLSRRTSCPTVAGPPPPSAPSSAAAAAASRRCSLPAVTSASLNAAGGHHYPPGAPADYTKFPGGPSYDEYYYPPETELDYAYQQSLLEMQRQMHLQELQMQEMQQRMRMQHHRMRQQQMLQQRHPHHAHLQQQQPVLAFQSGSSHTMHSGPVLSSHPEAPHGPEEDDDDFAEGGLDPLPMHEDPLLNIPVRTTAPESTAVPLVVITDSPGRSSPGSSNGKGATKKNKRSRDGEHGANQPRADLPEAEGTNSPTDSGTKPASVSNPSTPSGAAEHQDEVESVAFTAAAHPDPLPSSLEAVSKDGTALNSSLTEEGVMTLEEYRIELEKYMRNNHLGAPAASHHDDNPDFDEDDDEPSDLDDDDDEPKYLSVAASARPRRRGSRNSRGGVDRTVSGCSFMSTETFNSNLSIFSNMSLLSATLSSAAGSEADGVEGSGARERKMNMARSVSSNLSLMSDVTDVSQAIDDLRL